MQPDQSFRFSLAPMTDGTRRRLWGGGRQSSGRRRCRRARRTRQGRKSAEAKTDKVVKSTKRRSRSATISRGGSSTTGLRFAQSLRGCLTRQRLLACRAKVRWHMKSRNPPPGCPGGALFGGSWFSRRWTCGCGTRSGWRPRHPRRRRGWRRSERRSSDRPA